MSGLVLGLSAYYHDSAAALVDDGRIVAAVQEERFTRAKGTADLPVRSIDFVMREADAAPSDLAAVVFYENPYEKADRILSTYLAGDPRSARSFLRSMRTWMPEKPWVRSRVLSLLGTRTPFLFCDHHLSHASSAFFPSPFGSAATLTLDGVGEWSTSSIGVASSGSIELLEHVAYPDSLGLFYSTFTSYCGFKVNSGEYKLMGLAPYGVPRYAGILRSEVLHLEEDGGFALNPEYFGYFTGSRMYTSKLERLLGAPARHAEARLTQHHADVAASAQQVLDEAVIAISARAARVTGQRDLVLAGGVALNVTSVGKLERSGLFERVWVQPAAGDAGGALGAALWASHVVLGAQRPEDPSDSMSGAFLGPYPCAPEEEGVELEGYGLVGERFEDDALATVVASYIQQGRVVGVARGRMEFGPRALGARSILADARDPGMQSRLNLKTKFREGFRPFAPMVLAERADEWFDMGGRQSPYMLSVASVLAEHRVDEGGVADVDFATRASRVRSTIPAVTHVDMSARVQTVTKDVNPFAHMVLSEFERMTGCPVLANTSFNVRGEPIVCSAEDAIMCFLATDIDVLVLGNHVVVRSEQDLGVLSAHSSRERKFD